MGFPDHRTLNAVLTILLVALVCAAVYSARRILLLFVLAMFFAYLINPVVRFLQRHALFFRDLRGPAVVQVYLGFLIVIALLGYGVAPGLARETTRAVDEIPVVLDGLSTGEIVTDLGGKYGWSDEQEQRVKLFLLRHRDNIQDLTKLVDRYISHAAAVLACLVLIPVLAMFFLRDGDHIADGLIKIVFPPNSRETVRTIAAELHSMLTRYMRAQVVLCGLSFAYYSAAMLILKFPHAVALGALGGALEFIPAAGWMTTAAVVISVGMVSHSHWVWMIVLLIIWRVIQDYFAYPSIMGHELEIHPLAAIFAVLVGAEIGGIVGIYLSVPVVAALRVIWRMYGAPERSNVRARQLNITAEERPIAVQATSS
ncbi:MAG TPA: AI-2E family transporter [Candidatus Sulfotelmatobacter sp.]|nr:AI-2E family transporter [Candidatus Sulfotelmatobacter sp.]